MKEDIKYPYIGELKNNTGGVAVFNSEDSGAQLNCKGGGWYSDGLYVYSDDWNEFEFKNITSEYLDNTYGKVESKEHAEFIVELCRAHGVKFTGTISYKYKYFSIDCDGLYFWKGSGAAKDFGKKQITIPMPPKEAEAVDEWPVVGDEVLICDLEPDSRNIEFENEKVKVIAKTDDAMGTVLTISHKWKGIGAVMFKKNHVKKPKTPDEELRDDIEYAIHHFEGDKVAVRKWLMNKYTITKKQ